MAESHAPGRRIRVLLADDHGVVRTGIQMYLATHPQIEVVGEAATAQETVSLALKYLPDVVLVDLVMPLGTAPVPSSRSLDEAPGPAWGTHGIEAIRRLKRELPSVRCLALTSFSDEDKLLPALEAGAAGYLLKDVSPDELARAILAVAAGDIYLSSTVAGTVVRQLTRPKTPSPLDRLTPRERDVLRCLAEGQSNAEIAGKLVISEATVKSHVTRILRKLGVADRTQAALLAAREGLGAMGPVRPARGR
ncbi:response regulator transcription factor [Carboxydochorda subterranea]|uniref:Response regulator transcription factor n=1 Tax=Carboxydichorda subterranea TaxID=3109565 RepID=A0ABZ1BZS2_9FIRM|nr:response regulator transcription factor [Limnochorda sp. L945t]WRP18108.1 response regulator transcription factor [Limnochorda sp. L945t]